MRSGHRLDQRNSIAPPRSASVVDVHIDRITQPPPGISDQGKVRKAVIYSEERT